MVIAELKVMIVQLLLLVPVIDLSNVPMDHVKDLNYIVKALIPNLNVKKEISYVLMDHVLNPQFFVPLLNHVLLDRLDVGITLVNLI